MISTADVPHFLDPSHPLKTPNDAGICRTRIFPAYFEFSSFFLSRIWSGPSRIFAPRFVSSYFFVLSSPHARARRGAQSYLFRSCTHSGQGVPAACVPQPTCGCLILRSFTPPLLTLFRGAPCPLSWPKDTVPASPVSFQNAHQGI